MDKRRDLLLPPNQILKIPRNIVGPIYFIAQCPIKQPEFQLVQALSSISVKKKQFAMENTRFD
jgi:hypothetical protein